MKKEYIIEPLTVWKNRNGGTQTMIVLAISKDNNYIMVFGQPDEVSPLFHIDYFISKYQPNEDF